MTHKQKIEERIAKLTAMLPVAEEFDNGKSVEVCCDKRQWITSTNPTWDPDYQYRVKPEPREFWVNEYPDCDLIHIHKTKENAILYASPNAKRFKVVEVMEGK